MGGTGVCVAAQVDGMSGGDFAQRRRGGLMSFGTGFSSFSLTMTRHDYDGYGMSDVFALHDDDGLGWAGPGCEAWSGAGERNAAGCFLAALDKVASLPT